MIQYILEVSICWFVFYIIFLVALKRETFFSLNRCYLLVSLNLGLLLPTIRFIPSEWYVLQPSMMEPLSYIYSTPMQYVSQSHMVNYTSGSWFSRLLLLTYLLGALFLLFRFIRGLQKIYSLYNNSEKIVYPKYTRIRTNQHHLPFSFLHFVFVSNKIELETEMEQILQHEILHIKYKHTIDVLFLQMLNILFWFNPLIYLYKKALRESHEFHADAIVLKTTDSRSYSKMLLSRNSTGLEISLSHHFFKSFLNNRIQMINQKKSAKPAIMKYLIILPVILIFGVVFSFPSHLSNRASLTNSTSENAAFTFQDTVPDEIFRVVEEMPRFPGCEDIVGGIREKENCAKEKMLQYIANNIKYPVIAKNNSVQGMCVIQFVVDGTGKIKDAKIVRDIGAGCGDAALEVVNNMPDNWTPGRQRGKSVNVLYTLPVKFKLANDNIAENESNINIPFSDLKEKPLFIIDGHRFDQFNIGKIGSDNIESVNVYKGQKATEKFGPSGINGVVVVRLKKSLSKLELLNIQKNTIAKENNKLQTSQVEEIFHVVEQMPRFPGCEEIGNTHAEKEDCAKNKMLNFLYTNLKYPEEARKNKLEGMVVIQFVVDLDGAITDTKIVRDIGGGCGDAAKSAVEAMKTMSKPWIPGFQRGKAVKVLYTLPVKFKLDNSENNK